MILIDETGNGWFLAAAAFIGAVVGAATQIVSNVTTGEKWYEGVAGAAVGGAVYNVVAFTTGNTSVASYSSAAAESATNEIVSYIIGDKKLTRKNAIASAATVVKDTVLNGTMYSVSGSASGKIVKINSGWYKPRKLVNALTGKYAKRVWMQTAVQGVYNAIGSTTKRWTGKIIETAYKLRRI